MATHDFVVAPPGLWTTLKILLAPTLWVGESYVAGSWYLKKGNLADFLELIKTEANATFKAYYYLLSGIKGLRFWLRQRALTRYYTRKVRSHYEVDSRVYELFLDKEMLYTCAFFLHDSNTLAEAQQNKLSAVIDRLSLPSHSPRVLDIGCGWGGMARAIVTRHDTAEVCGLTISERQITWAKQRDAHALSPSQLTQICYKLEDYVDHNRVEYYHAVSVIGMIEHVGLSGYGTFFDKIHNLLQPGGTAVIHTIISPVPAHPANAWIDRHIFTGGHTPSISEVARAAELHRFYISGIFVYPPKHYRRTIECWLRNFQDNLGSITQYLRETGYADREIEQFARTWIFYLSGVRNMFAEGRDGSYQIAQFSIRKLPENHSSK